jgi:hypothetical protein
MMSVDHSIMLKLLIGDSVCGIYISRSLGGRVGGLLRMKLVHSCHFFKVYLNDDDNNDSNKCFLWLCMQPKNERISAAAQCNLTQFLYPIMILSYSWLLVKVRYNKYCV